LIGLVIVAHGGLARELLAAVEHVVGKQEHAVAVAIAPQDDLRAKQAEVNAAVAEVDEGDGVVLVTDMFGGSPSNLAMGAMSGVAGEVIYGANLPLLVKFAKCRHLPLADAIDCALIAGRKYCDSAGSILATRRKQA
jgi:PTS system mannose-specific IIA component